MTMSRLLFALLTPCSCFPGVSVAQISPTAMRSGIDSLQINSNAVSGTLLTVPPDQRFVLTDFTAPNMGNNGSVWQIMDGSTARWSVNVVSLGGPNLVSAHESWSTGLVFEPGSTVRIQETGPSSTFNVRYAWSGYLVPVSTASVPSRPRTQLGFNLSPNPSRQVVTLKFELSQPADIDLAIFDATGRRVRVLQSGRLATGPHEETWDGRNEVGDAAAPGVYFARLASSKSKSVRKLVRVQ